MNYDFQNVARSFPLFPRKRESGAAAETVAPDPRFRGDGKLLKQESSVGSGMVAFLGLFRRDLGLALRQSGDTGHVLGIVVLVVVLFAFGVGPEAETLRRIGAGIIWVGALLAALLSLDRLFQPDYEDGGLDLLALSSLPLEFGVLA